jgi:hypothetical protein
MTQKTQDSDDLNQQAKEISKWNTILISYAAQVQEQYQNITCKNIGQYRYHLKIPNMSSMMGAGLTVLLYCGMD